MGTIACVSAGLAAACCLCLAGSVARADGPEPEVSRNEALPRVLGGDTTYDRAAIISIDDEITDITRDSIRRRFQEVRDQGIKLVVLELDTPGGMVSSTLEICNEIRRLQDAGVTIYSWVNDKAYSGGTIVALATNGIIMAPNATIGDSQMILVTPEGVSAVPEDLEAKRYSPLYAELRDSARRNGYNFDLLLAFVRPELEIYWIENTATQERRFVTAEKRNELLNPKPNAENGDRSDETQAGVWRDVQSVPGLIENVPRPIDGAKELLTLRTVEARAYGLALATAASESELAGLLKVSGPLDRMRTTWLEWIAGWLASPMVRGVLFLLMLLGAYAEFKTPGFSLPGAVALICLILFLGAPYAAGFAVTWEIVVILLGILLLVVEVFVIPGFGIAGIAGLVLLAVGLVSSFIPTELPGPGSGVWPSGPLAMDYLRRGLWSLAGGLTGSLVGMAVLARVMPKLPVAGKLIAANPTREQVVVDDPYEGMAQLGHIGRSEGVLRPAGKARFGAILVDVVSDGEFIPAGTRVEVVERAGSRVVVRRVD